MFVARGAPASARGSTHQSTTAAAAGPHFRRNWKAGKEGKAGKGKGEVGGVFGAGKGKSKCGGKAPRDGPY